MRIIFTVNMSRRYSDLLTDEGVGVRLVSYYYTRDEPTFNMPYYIKRGRLKTKKGKTK